MENSTNKKDMRELGKNTQFSSTNQPEKRGLPKGYKNQATLVKKFLDIENIGKDIDGEHASLSQEEQITIALINKAKMTGDRLAWKDLMVARYGKAPDRVEIEKPEPEYDYSMLSTEELLTVERILKKVKTKEKSAEY